VTAPLLVMAVGNPSRGDDALGPSFIERAETALAQEIAAGAVELLTDFQLQIEHALDLMGRRRVVFVDASVTAPAPFAFARVLPERDATAASHAMSPAAVLDAHRRAFGEPPPAWVLGIRGERFELGEALSSAAREHLEAAVRFFVQDAKLFLGGERAG
jgi:hydrogenase maturation protease